MQDTEMFLSLAEIAGVFVGFGALISVRSGTGPPALQSTGSGQRAPRSGRGAAW